MNWIEISIFTTTQAIEIISGILIQNKIGGLVVEDSNDFKDFLNDTTIHWDYVDEDLMKLENSETCIKFYVPENMQGQETLKAIKFNLDIIKKQNLDIDFGSLKINNNFVNEQDWETAWKKYYHITKVGENIIICPCWKNYDKKKNEIVLKLDPGMAFGTGTHETTRLCMELLEQIVTQDTSVLDIGTGSGILAITSLLLKAEKVVAVDIDENSVKIANDNAILNNVDKQLNLLCGDLTEKVAGKYDIICANIVADVIIRLCDNIKNFMHNQTILLVSGIIDDREQDVRQAIDKCGLKVTKTLRDNGWVAMKCEF